MKKTYAKREFNPNYSELLTQVVTEKGTISECFRMFYQYSVHNQLLAYYQMKLMNLPITPINSFTGWNKLGRKIKPKSKAIFLWQPIMITTREKNADGIEEEVKKTIFKFKPSWFCMAQTEGADADIKPEDVKVDGFNLNEVYKKFDIKLVDFEHMNGNVQGYANIKEKTLALNPMATDCEMTIFHEIAHIALKHDEKLSHSLKELEAETVAYIVGSVLGLPEKQLSDSRGYIQGYFKENQIPDKNARRIMNVADKILKAGLGK